jgi:hypothetical protein
MKSINFIFYFYPIENCFHFLNISYDWSIHRNNYSVTQLAEMVNFIEKRKLLNNKSYSENNIPNINVNDLNDMQTFVYKFVKYFMKTNEQLLLIINGEGGTGKTFLIYALSKFIGNKLKRCAPTAKEAFLIKGQTLHSLFRIHCSKKADYYQPLSGLQLNLFKHEFEGILLD